MGNDLMTEEVEIDPFGRRSPFPTSKHLTVEQAGCIKVVDGKREMKTGTLGHVISGCVRGEHGWTANVEGKR
jgi:hypothetical protein